MAIKSNVFEEFVFHKSFGILWLLVYGSFRRMLKHAFNALSFVGRAWVNNELLSFGTFACMIKTAFFGSIAISYFVVTSFTIVLVSGLVGIFFVAMLILFAIYQVIVGIMFGIVDAFRSYISAVAKWTFGA